MYTLTNSFHNTKVRTRFSVEELAAMLYKVNRAMPGQNVRKERRLIARLKRTLCGANGCTCSNDFGVR